eukprot:830414-Rhodomonas_salina.2
MPLSLDVAGRGARGEDGGAVRGGSADERGGSQVARLLRPPRRRLRLRPRLCELRSFLLFFLWVGFGLVLVWLFRSFLILRLCRPPPPSSSL